MNKLAEQAVRIAGGEIGKGEEGRNNSGPHVFKYTNGREGSWCAAFLSWCFEGAELATEIPAPKRSHSAKGFVKNVAKEGRWVDVDEEPLEPGDVICWHRGSFSWQGHVGIVLCHLPNSDTLITIEGNKGKFPSVVSVHVYPNGAWRKKLYRVARVD